MSHCVVCGGHIDGDKQYISRLTPPFGHICMGCAAEYALREVCAAQVMAFLRCWAKEESDQAGEGMQTAPKTAEYLEWYYSGNYLICSGKDRYPPWLSFA